MDHHLSREEDKIWEAVCCKSRKEKEGGSVREKERRLEAAVELQFCLFSIENKNEIE